jgi:hypothetical protein
MPFRSPHVSYVSFSIEVTPAGTSNVMVVETDLHLNSWHTLYDDAAVKRLLAAAQDYLSANAAGLTHIRLFLSWRDQAQLNIAHLTTLQTDRATSGAGATAGFLGSVPG